jgi:hypothetical protein
MYPVRKKGALEWKTMTRTTAKARTPSSAGMWFMAMFGEESTD